MTTLVGTCKKKKVATECRLCMVNGGLTDWLIFPVLVYDSTQICLEGTFLAIPNRDVAWLEVKAEPPQTYPSVSGKSL